ncbi:MAG: M48 family metalloprotease, partial [Elioraea tepidiphila]
VGEIAGVTFQNAGTGTLAAGIATFGQAFVAGDLPAGSTLMARIGATLVPVQVDAKTFHPDGSVSFAVLSFARPALAAGEVLVHPLALLLLWFGPTAADLLALSVSRRREFLADAGAVDLTGDPEGLAAALARLDRLQGDDWERLAGRNGPRWLRLFRTHPTIAERIARLAEMRRTEPLPLPERFGWGREPRRNPWQGAVRRWRL